MSEYVDLDSLFRPRLKEADHEIPDLGLVRLRGLSQGEAVHVGAAGDDLAEANRRTLAQGLVAPKLTVDGLLHEPGAKPCKACAPAKGWQDAGDANEVNEVLNRITGLSGLAPDSDKEANKSFPDEPES